MKTKLAVIKETLNWAKSKLVKEDATIIYKALAALKEFEEELDNIFNDNATIKDILKGELQAVQKARADLRSKYPNLYKKQEKKL